MRWLKTLRAPCQSWRFALWVVGILVPGLVGGCAPSVPEVVVYCALDREFSEPILLEFERETDIRVRAKYDTESTKSVGLAELLLREQNRPRADVFWNNEVMNTLRLAEAGALSAYAPAEAAQYPAWARDPDQRWHGFAARARVLIINTAKVAEPPTSLLELADPRWRGQVGIAKPLFGTTATHVAMLFGQLGPEPAKEWLAKLKENDLRILSGNKQVAVEVGQGVLAMGLTDTDDALVEQAAGRPIRMVFLDSAAAGPGHLLIPNTVALINGAPNPDAGRRLIDYLLRPETEAKLAQGASGQIPLHPGCAAKPPFPVPPGLLTARADFAAGLRQWELSRAWLKEHFTVD